MTSLSFLSDLHMESCRFGETKAFLKDLRPGGPQLLCARIRANPVGDDQQHKIEPKIIFSHRITADRRKQNQRHLHTVWQASLGRSFHASLWSRLFTHYRLQPVMTSLHLTALCVASKMLRILVSLGIHLDKIPFFSCLRKFVFRSVTLKVRAFLKRAFLNL